MKTDTIFGIKSPLGKVGWQKFWLFKVDPDIENEQKRSVNFNHRISRARSMDTSVLMRFEAIVTMKWSFLLTNLYYKYIYMLDSDLLPTRILSMLSISLNISAYNEIEKSYFSIIISKTNSAWSKHVCILPKLCVIHIVL